MFFKLRQSKDSFEKCLKPHLSYLYRIALRLTGNSSDAEDLVQDLILKVHSGKTDLFTLDNPKTWLSKVMYRLFIDKYRQKQRFSIVPIESLDQDLVNETQIDESENPEHLIEQQHLIQKIEQALQTINEEQRILIIMYEIEGFSLPEISEMLDIPIGTLKSRLHRARTKLRHYLETSLETSFTNKGTDRAKDTCTVTYAQQKITK